MRDKDVTVYISPRAYDGIPMDVFASISTALGFLYPNARMGPGEGSRGVAIVISEEDRKPKRVLKRAIVKGKETTDDPDSQVGVIGFNGQDLTTTVPEEAAEILTRYGAAILLGTKGAVNYVEQRATLPDGRALTMTVQWVQGKSPSEMRAAAEAERDAALARITRVVALVDSWDAEDPTGPHAHSNEIRAALADLEGCN